MQMTRGLLILFVSVLLLSGCSTFGTTENVQKEYAAVNRTFKEQKNYQFHGQTRLLTGSDTNGNAVTFSGQVNEGDVLLNLQYSDPDRKRVENVSLLSGRNGMFVQRENQAWRHAGLDGLVRQEFANWNPLSVWQQMDMMKTNILPLQDNDKEDNVKAIRVLVDSRRLKEWLTSALKERFSQRVQSTTVVPRVKYAMTLSQGMGLGEARTQNVATITREEIDELVNQMELEAEYTVFYDVITKLPLEIDTNIRSDYHIRGQRIVEHTKIQTFLRNYGTPGNLPDLSPAMPR